MAKPIKETPVLTGDDAVRFRKAVEDVVPVSEEEKREARAIYEKVMKNNKILFG